MDPEQSALLIYGLLRNLLFLRGYKVYTVVIERPNSFF